MPTIESSRAKAIADKIQAHRVSEDQYVVYNPSNNPITKYSVHRSPGGTWYCTCPYATRGNHLRNGSECKHLRRVLDKLQGCGKGTCRADKLCPSCSFTDRMLS